MYLSIQFGVFFFGVIVSDTLYFRLYIATITTFLPFVDLTKDTDKDNEFGIDNTTEQSAPPS